ncbi:hypothetical protein ACJJIW_12345 [Microbulbifer sp. JMSA004]|uniref:hypothetical protein n=1 Tax=Microbulbifer sp. JMSA004 TaxID=3243370 RepID=UPI00403A52FD
MKRMRISGSSHGSAEQECFAMHFPVNQKKIPIQYLLHLGKNSNYLSAVFWKQSQ